MPYPYSCLCPCHHPLHLVPHACVSCLITSALYSPFSFTQLLQHYTLHSHSLKYFSTILPTLFPCHHPLHLVPHSCVSCFITALYSLLSFTQLLQHYTPHSLSMPSSPPSGSPLSCLLLNHSPLFPCHHPLHLVTHSRVSCLITPALTHTYIFTVPHL
jgi:hypothetical protein